MPNTTLQLLAEKTGISRSNLNRYEKDEVKPSADSIVILCDLYNVSTDWLLRGIEPQAQKVEAISDPDLKDMTDILKNLMESDDSDLRGWTKIQFKTTFKEYYATHKEKKP
ncbi:transcriptional regulator with XRE-family HTH domain [Sporomusaceae bacterium BoRhaA]|uniref:helix-turn-helix domain-containing protein n=1 Tax=Pelorhabdus rhamnosifermentans TaxID=2772457 RepID=UPI001C060698|nr:helix-turn-helix transcriptional regulator [Pelorhabdus rhamnosifermentans]MBU2699709.1 transcriptional regulator with XRE-family HTH domain [Pelorhabdus rhamnosifermentans]